MQELCTLYGRALYGCELTHEAGDGAAGLTYELSAPMKGNKIRKFKKIREV